MLQIDKAGRVINDRVADSICPALEHGDMPVVRGIIVHQTGSASAQSTLASYKHVGAVGAHFLIDKDGSIYQTTSLRK
jgi:N-acetyl-anhydromuramyl-L-alanine amidase AmpD